MKQESGDSINKLFVYGTLGPGRPNEHIMTRIGGTFEEASVRGNLHPEGWGATMGYPALVLDEAGEEVKGFLFRSEKLENHWKSLDNFEGDAYARVATQVHLPNGSKEKAYLYVLNPDLT